MSTPRLGAPELSTSQASKEATVNEAVRYIEAGSGHFIFKDRDLATPPGSPADGDCYLVAASPTGAWSGQAGKIAFRVNTAWAFITVIEGMTAWVNDENVFIGYDGADWNALATPSGVYQPLDADLTAIAGLTSAADKGIQFTGAGTAATFDLTAAGKALLDDANAAAQRATLGGTTVGSNVFTLTNPSAITFLRVNADNSVDALNADAFRTAIGAGTGSGSGDLVAANNLSDVANAVTSRTNLGVGTGDSPQFTAVNIGHASDTTVSRVSAGDIAVEGNAIYRAGGTDVPVADGGTGASTAAGARTNLGLGTVAILDETTTAQFRSNTADKALSTDQVWAAADYVALTDAATVAVDMSTGINFSLTIGGNRTLGNPSNTKNGQTGCIAITQDGTGSRTLAYGSNWDFAGGTAPVLSTAAGARDLLFYQVISSTSIYANLVKAIS